MKKNKRVILSLRIEKHGGTKGFTLIEVALAVMVIGLIMAPLLALYSAEQKQQMINGTVGRLGDIRETLDYYAENNDRFPLPASFLTSEADPEHGMEGVTPDICPDVTINGFCLLDRGTPSPDDDIYIGAVPFAALRMESEMAIDTWGNKIMYAVARIQTDASTFEILGSDVISDMALNYPSNDREPEGTNAYDAYLISFGVKGKGAYSAEGILTSDCIELGNPEYEDDNCSFLDATFLADVNPNEIVTPYGTEPHGTRTDVDNIPEYYDDVTLPVSRPNISEWNENVNDFRYVTTIKNRLGIGVTNPLNGVDVGGDVLIDGNLVVPEICAANAEGWSPDPDPAAGESEEDYPRSCFHTIKIYGDDADMDCDQNNIPGVEPVIAIGTRASTAQVFCGSPVDGSGEPIVDQVDEDDERYGSFRFTGITFENPSGGSENCTDEGQNLASITGTGIGTITCTTPF